MPGVHVPQQQEKKDPLDTVIKGLQIASSIYGIKTDMAKLEEHSRATKAAEAKEAAAQGEKDFAAKGGMSQAEYRSALKDGFTPVAPGSEGAVSAFIRTPEGKEQPIALKPPEAKGLRAPTRAIETVENGKPVTKIVEDVPGQSYAAQPKATPVPKDITVQERNTLQNQYDRDLAVRRNEAVMSSYQNAKNLIKDPSPASDQALIFSYMKALDPSSVVRESEFETAQAIGSLQERAAAKLKSMAGDGILTDKQRQDLLSQMQSLAKTAVDAQENMDNQFSALAQRRGVDTKDLRFKSRPSFDEKLETTAVGDKPPAAPKVGDEIDGFIFKGGDPGDKGNWVQKLDGKKNIGNAAAASGRW